MVVAMEKIGTVAKRVAARLLAIRNGKILAGDAEAPRSEESAAMPATGNSPPSNGIAARLPAGERTQGGRPAGVLEKSGAVHNRGGTGTAPGKREGKSSRLPPGRDAHAGMKFETVAPPPRAGRCIGYPHASAAGFL